MTSSNPPPPQRLRLTKGRQKIEIKRIPIEKSLLVAFSKRRSGLFKKASEICTLCGVEMALIVLSPTKKVFSFGNPSVQTVVDRFLNKNLPTSLRTSQLIQHYHKKNIQQLNMRLTNLLGQLEAEKKTSEELIKIRKAKEFLWDASYMENLGVEELEKLVVAVLELKKNAEKQAEKLKAEMANISAATLRKSDSTWLAGVGRPSNLRCQEQ